MKKIVFFCLIIFCSICSNAETWREFFCKQISQNIDNYPSKADFESFKENLENQNYKDCLIFLEELENQNLNEDQNKSLLYTYYFKAYILALLQDNSAEDYLFLAKDVNEYIDFELDFINQDFWKLAIYFQQNSKDSTLFQQSIKLEKELNRNTKRLLYLNDEYQIPYQELEDNYQKLNRPIGIMRIEFFRMINNFSLSDKQFALDCCNKILQISKENNIKNYYTKIAEKVSEKDFFDNYKKLPLTSLIIISSISLIVIILAVSFGFKHKDK